MYYSVRFVVGTVTPSAQPTGNNAIDASNETTDDLYAFEKKVPPMVVSKIYNGFKILFSLDKTRS